MAPCGGMEIYDTMRRRAYGTMKGRSMRVYGIMRVRTKRVYGTLRGRPM